MAEELRIIVTDEGGPPPATAPVAPPVGTSPSVPASATSSTAGVPGVIPGVPGSIPIPPPIEPPPFTPLDRRNQSLASARRTAQAGVSGISAIAAGNVGGVAAVASSALAAITGPVGVASIAITGALGATALALKAFVGAVQRNANDLAGLSTELSAVQAIGGIRREFAQLRRAQQIGPGLARFENLRQQAATQMFDIGTQILDILLQLSQKLEPFIDLALVVLGGISSFLEKNGTSIAEVLAFILRVGNPLFGTIEVIGQIARQFGVQINNNDPDANADPFTNSFLRGIPPQPDRMQFKRPLAPIAGGP